LSSSFTISDGDVDNGSQSQEYESPNGSILYEYESKSSSEASSEVVSSAKDYLLFTTFDISKQSSISETDFEVKSDIDSEQDYQSSV
jgi:hypothetical protein